MKSWYVHHFFLMWRSCVIYLWLSPDYKMNIDTVRSLEKKLTLIYPYKHRSNLRGGHVGGGARISETKQVLHWGYLEHIPKFLVRNGLFDALQT